MYQGDGVMKPTLGRIVHILHYGQVMAGLVVDVYDDEENAISMIAWNARAQAREFINVPFSKNIAKDEGHWFWPPMPMPSAEDVKKMKDRIIEQQQKVKPT